MNYRYIKLLHGEYLCGPQDVIKSYCITGQGGIIQLRFGDELHFSGNHKPWRILVKELTKQLLKEESAHSRSQFLNELIEHLETNEE